MGVKFLKERLDIPVVPYKFLLNKTRSKLFEKHAGIVVLIPKKGTTSGHFIILLARRNHIEYFSSLGNSPQSELGKLHEPLGIMTNILGRDFIYNRAKLQQNTYKIQDCAAWVLLRWKFKHLKLREFVKLFQNKITLSSSDDIAALMTLVLLTSK